MVTRQRTTRTHVEWSPPPRTPLAHAVTTILSHLLHQAQRGEKNRKSRRDRQADSEELPRLAVACHHQAAVIRHIQQWAVLQAWACRGAAGIPHEVDPNVPRLVRDAVGGSVAGNQIVEAAFNRPGAGYWHVEICRYQAAAIAREAATD